MTRRCCTRSVHAENALKIVTWRSAVFASHVWENLNVSLSRRHIWNTNTEENSAEFIHLLWLTLGKRGRTLRHLAWVHPINLWLSGLKRCVKVISLGVFNVGNGFLPRKKLTFGSSTKMRCKYFGKKCLGNQREDFWTCCLIQVGLRWLIRWLISSHVR